MEGHAWHRAEKSGGLLRLIFGGDWNIGQAARLDEPLRDLDVAGVKEIEIDASGLKNLDSVGAWLLLRTKERLAAEHKVRVFKIPPAFESLFKTLKHRGKDPLRQQPERRGFTEFLDRLGGGTIQALQEGYAMLGYLGLVSSETARTFAHSRRLRLPALINQIEQTGLNALPIVGLLSAMVGVVLAYQGAEQLKRFGAQLFTVDLLGIGTLRELGGLLTAIIVAGRSGSAFTAQIGTMKLNQEIDAMETFGLSTTELLVLPRVFGLMITLPLLTLYANIMTLSGGAAMCYFYLHIGTPTFLHELIGAITLKQLWVGLLKAPVYAFIIAFVGCFEGLRVTGNAESVGRLTTRSVVASLFLVIIFDGGFSILFSILEI
jgi:phospholipid/cholesterol/gamma-HCH transport system permease protein